MFACGNCDHAGILVVILMIDPLLVSFCRRPFASFFQAENAEWTDFKTLRVGVFSVGGGLYFAAEGVFHHGLEGGAAAGGDGLGLDQQSIIQIERRLHRMGDNMVLWASVNTGAAPPTLAPVLRRSYFFFGAGFFAVGAALAGFLVALAGAALAGAAPLGRKAIQRMRGAAK